MSATKKLNVDLRRIDLSDLPSDVDEQISNMARFKKMPYIVAANAVLVNRTLEDYGGCS